MAVYRTHLLGAFAALIASSLFQPALSVIGCTEETTCLNTTTPRCLQFPASQGGIPCTLDYAFNETGYCACGTQSCSPLTGSNTTSKPQLLVIGDSISMGYVGALAATLSEYEVVHSPGNADNTNLGLQCVKPGQWLGPDASRWDVVTTNWGLHDLAYMDNEHIDVTDYARLLGDIFTSLATYLKPEATIIWNTITPVPTNPNASCVLIPGRIETDVLKYNAAAASVVINSPYNISHCDLHEVITNYCGVGYSTCNITQCGGPHFSSTGFSMLGVKVAQCVRSASGK